MLDVAITVIDGARVVLGVTALVGLAAGTIGILVIEWRDQRRRHTNRRRLIEPIETTCAHVRVLPSRPRPFDWSVELPDVTEMG